MKIIVTESQINRILYPYFDMMFEGSELVHYIDRDNDWIGFKKNINGEDTTIIGRPVYVDWLWFVNDSYFKNAWTYFNIGPKEFKVALKNYLNDKYKLAVKDIT